VRNAVALGSFQVILRNAGPNPLVTLLTQEKLDAYGWLLQLAS
jgi:hypothetical protein